MTGYLKLAAFAVFAFAVPVGFALLVSPFLFEEAFPKQTLQTPQNTVRRPTVPVVFQEDLDTTDHGAGRWYARVANSQNLDPVKQGLFIVSFLVRFKELPQEALRHNIIEKYETDTRPYAGWAVGIQRINGIVRPQVYWRDNRGKGGWYTFRSVELEKNRWYSLSLVARDAEYIALYLESLENQDPVSGTETVQFLGGHPLGKVSTPETGADVSLGVVRTNGKSFQGDFGYVAVARPSTAKEDIQSIRSLLAGGPVLLKQKLSAEDLLLFINETWQDESGQNHVVERSAAAG